MNQNLLVVIVDIEATRYHMYSVRKALKPVPLETCKTDKSLRAPASVLGAWWWSSYHTMDKSGKLEPL